MSRRSFSGLFLSFLFASLFSSLPVSAYTQTLKNGGGVVRWSGQPYLALAGNPANRVGLTPQDVWNSVTRGLQRWQQASENHVRFDYWQDDRFERDSDYNGLSNLYFASSATGATGLSAGVLGLTQVWYDTSNGNILETDIVLNDNDFAFTTNPADSSGSGAGWPTGKVYLDNVVTHELGHAFGLAHASGLQSTMLYVEGPDQSHLSCDDQTAIRALYDSRGDLGSMSGRITGPNGAGVFGATVLAISAQRGVAVATGITKSDGSYKIDSLEPGNYQILVEPFTTSAASLPQYFSGINPNICSGQSFVRQFSPGVLTVTAGGNASRDQAVNCDRPYGAGAEIVQTGSVSMGASSPVVVSGGGTATFAYPDAMGYAGRTYYALKAVQGDIDLHVLSYSLYSPVSAALKLYNSSGRTVAVQDPALSYQSESGFRNYDGELKASGLALGDYYLEVTLSDLPSVVFPVWGNDMDSRRFFVVTGVLNKANSVLSDAMPEHPKCRSSENFANYQSPSNGPTRKGLIGGQQSTPENSKFLGFCGTVQRGGPSGGAPFSMIFSWFLPWIFMLVYVKSLRLRRSSDNLGT